MTSKDMPNKEISLFQNVEQSQTFDMLTMTYGWAESPNNNNNDNNNNNNKPSAFTLVWKTLQWI